MNLPDPNMQVMGGMADVGGMQVQLSPEDAQALLAAAEEAKQQQKSDMVSLMRRLQDKLETVIKARRPIEQRWVDDLRQYDGAPRIRMSKQDTTSSSGAGEPPKIHATRLATDHFEARMSDTLFPTNDYAFDLKLTPDDEWQPATQENPEFGMAEVPQAPDVKSLEEACRRMKKVICDQLGECKFPSIGRSVVRDAARIGAGVIMGPVNVLRVRRRFKGPAMTMDVQETTVPEVKYVDPWDFYPDMVPSAERAEFAFCLNLMSRTEVQDLRDYPSFDSDEIGALLKEEPDLGELSQNLAYRNSHLQRVEQTSDKYAIWRYTGVLTPKEIGAISGATGEVGKAVTDDLSAMGVDCTCDDARMPMVDMWFSQGRVLKARLRPIERDYRIPYYVFSPFQADDTMFGYGIPYMGRDSARVLDAAWQIALHNASMSAGPLIVLRAGKIEPRDRSLEFRGPKVMEVTDPDVQLGDAITVINMQNNMAQALEIVDRAQAIHDRETMLPDIMQGDGTNAVPTASGLAMQLNSTTILIKRGAACADDDLFAPLIQRMYWWNMLFNDRADIKGDYDVVPLGQSKQMVKDIQVQHLQAFMSMTAADPDLKPYVDKYGALKMWASLAELPVDQLLLDKDTVDQKMAQMPNPGLDLANAKVAEAGAKAKKLNVEADVAQASIQSQVQSGAISPQEAELQMADYNVRREEAAASVQVATIKAQTDSAKAQIHQHVSAASNATTQTVATIKSQADLTREGMKTRIAAEQLARGQ